ncbi:MAG: hypothetical protein KZQ89_13170 [Candidatus Thiodiazotropha sp. (ex Lucinoma kastoroae)]|nr:hypothetical protein [Candidatus Thiodiazotropha sp. (ex Rostrolucina anterorostrata)]MCU7848926.1 hypothetical protein [Candidatus Thiodiazotropha sp. (ex Lucinoma kastoroae)]
MTGNTLGFLKIVHFNATVTGITDQILVFTLERKFGVVPMIEFDLSPVIHTMTILALLIISSLMLVIFFMT